MDGTLAITGDPQADALLNGDPFALLLGMLLDQQIPMEAAFMAPHRLAQRMGGSLDVAALAALPAEEVESIFRERPALHRFPKSMGDRAHRLSQAIVEHYGADAENIWNDVADGGELYRRLRELPGFGDEKTRIFVALLAKRIGVRPAGWQEAAGPFADDEPRSVADIDSRETFDQVRAWKKAQKAKGKGKSE